MHRIQIQLTASQERILRDIAKLRGSSISALVRGGVEQIIEPERERLEESRRRALRLVGAITDKADVARRHDEYLDKSPSRRPRRRP